MWKVSTSARTLLTLGFLLIAATAALALDWPLKTAIDIASGFGDFRTGHFHAGVDIRTGGAEGLEVFCPVDGYVSRVKMSYTGYGRGLYVTGTDGRVYVWGHLSRLADRIAGPVAAQQISQQRYPQDIEFPRDSIKVTRGERIAWSGQSGNGGPHLHLETRSPDNRPLNPLTHGFELADKTRPVFSRIGFQMTDERSLFDDGSRKMFFDVKGGRAPGQYYLDTTLYLHRPFGLLAGCRDLMRPDGPAWTVYSVVLYFDDKPYYEVVLDTIDYATTDAVSLEYDFLSACAGDQSLRRLFRKVGNAYAGSRDPMGNGGVFGVSGEKLGKHRGKIVATDCSGNQSSLSFDFMWGPPGNILELDSSEVVSWNHYAFFFRPVAEYADYGIDSLAVFVNREETWRPADSTRVTTLDDGRLRCDVVSPEVDVAPLRVFFFNDQGGLIRDDIFSGIHDRGKPAVEMTYDIVEDGLLVTLRARVNAASKTRVELYRRDSLLGVEYPRCFNLKTYLCLIPPSEKYARIDRIGFAMSADSTMKSVFKDSLNIVAIGLKDTDQVSFGDRFVLTVRKDDLYQPQYIEVSENIVKAKSLLSLNTENYVIKPEEFVCRRALGLSMSTPFVNEYNKYSGICRLDKKNDRWVWLDGNRFTDNRLTAAVLGGGSLAGVIDYEPPEIFHLNVKTGLSFKKEGFAVTFGTRDTLSGIPEDQGITVKIDGKWLPAGYDPETRLARAEPSETLAPGEHHLAVVVVDRVGNTAERYAKFSVR